MNLSLSKSIPVLALCALGTSLSPAAVIESFETLPLFRNGSGFPPDSPPYTNVSQSTVAGVTHGTYSLVVAFTNADWSWMYKAVASGGTTNSYYGPSTYLNWHRHKTLKLDMHRPALPWGWNLEFVMAINGPQGWNQNQLVPWTWHNAGQTSSETLSWDYSSIRNSVGTFGGYWQLAFTAHGNQPGGGTVYFDNLRFEDLVEPNLGFVFPTNASSGDLQGWGPQGWGTALAATYWDPADATNGTSSGSMYCFCDFASATTNQSAVFQAWNIGFDTREFVALGFDVKVDAANSSTTTAGDYGNVLVVLRGTDIDWNPIATFNIPASAATSFQHFEVPLYQPLPTNMIGMNLIFGGTNFQGAVNYYVDNILFLGATNAPVLTLDKALPGLELSAAGSATDQRQSIRTATSHDWTTSPGLLTYSMTINEGLSAQTADAMAYIFLVGTTNSNPGVTPDWNESDGIFLEIRQQSNGLCTAALQYKTNAPNSNGVRYTPAGTLAVVSNVPMTGAWSLRIDPSLNQFLLTPPAGSSTNGSFPAAVAEFSTNVFAYFGLQPNQTSNLGRYINLSRAQILSGATPLMDQVFTTQSSLNTSVFVVRAANASGIQMRPTNIVYRLSWPAPPSTHELQSASSLGGPWSNPGLPLIIAGSRNVTFIPSTTLSSATVFFRLRIP